VWVTGVNTENLVDDESVDTSKRIFSCVGNKTYTTTTGASRTIMEVKLVDIDGTLKVLRPIAESRGFRVWGEGGNRLGIAKFIRATKKSVTIHPIGAKKRMELKRATLTPADEEWVKSQEKPKG
jgi:hypothetical protein